MSKNKPRNRTTGQGVTMQEGQTPEATDAAVTDGTVDETVSTETQAEAVENQTSDAPAVVNEGVQDNTAEAVSDVKADVKDEPMPAVQQKQVNVSSEFDALIDNLRANGTALQKSLIATLDGYLLKMAPGVPIGEDKGAHQQYTLWKTIQSVCENSTQEEFKKLWNILLAYFENYKDGAFHERYVFRFSEYWHYGETDLNGFQRILNLIKLTASQNDRVSGLKQVDLTRTLADGFSDEARQRLVQFYNQ